MSAAAAQLPLTHLLAGVAPALQRISRDIREATAALRGTTAKFRDAEGKVKRIADQASGAGTTLKRFRAEATSAGDTVTKLGRSKAHSGVKSIGTKAGTTKGALGKLGKGLGGILTFLLPMLPIADIVTGLMDKFGLVMEIASVAMTGINLAMRSNPLGFLLGILMPVAGWLIDYAMNSETGQRIMKQVFQQALKVFQSIWKFLQPILKLIGTLVMNYFKAYLTVITTALKIIADGIHGFSHVQSIVTSATHQLHGIASSTIGAIKNVIHPLLSFFTESVPGFFSHAKDAVGNALHGMGELIKGALTAVIGVVKGPIDGLIAFANWIIDGLNKLSFDFLGKHFGVDIPKIPMLAEGGVVFPGAPDAPRIDPLTALESRRVPAITEAPRQPHRIRDFHEDPGAGPRSTAEDLLFLAGAHC
ncbi:tape-measure protein [Streptomyces sp. NPDC004327]|uniref:tape-measure protein n=1 Tax=unclassified Streptomyces TaxID=2593676 RepID=UPI0036BFB36A